MLVLLALPSHCVFLSVRAVTTVGLPSDLQRGVSFVAYGRNDYASAEATASLSRLAETGATWVAILVTWYQVDRTSNKIFSDPKRTPSDESVESITAKARELGLNITLKLNIRSLDATLRKKISPADWDVWFENLRTFLNHYAAFAERLRINELILGTELDSSVGFEDQWRQAITEVRSRYNGPITYGASRITCSDNLPPRCQPGYELVKWWDALDLVAIEGWFPLTNRTDPSTEEMNAGWTAHIADIENWRASIGKPVIFTEVGCPSYDGGNMHPSKEWEGEPVDLQEQADFYEAAFEAFSSQYWLKGYYWWYWYWRPNAGEEGDGSWDLQNKPAAQILSKWYSAPPIAITTTTSYSTSGTSAPSTSNTSKTIIEDSAIFLLALPVVAMLVFALWRSKARVVSMVKASRRFVR